MTRSRESFLWSVPIGTLGGLIGLGGAEFRLPVLVGPLRLSVHRAVPFNLAVSLVTVMTALATRAGALSLEGLRPLAWVILFLVAGSTAAAWVTARLTARISREALERVILVLLVGIGGLLIAEGVGGAESPTALAPDGATGRALLAVLLGIAIGAVSSLLGVAGGELLIPTFLFVFGAPIHTAGTASLLVSLPMVAAGVWRHAGQGAYSARADVRAIIVPMAIGSVLGAVLGGLLAGVAPARWLKLGLGLILIGSAVKVFRRVRPRAG